MSAEVEPEGGWRQHMLFDTEQRRKKAQKIISILSHERPLLGARVLEIGTGTGVIGAELARAVGVDGRVVSIDTMDTRVESEGYEFHLTSGVVLPFEACVFDVVVSNHVLEHVGVRAEQQKHVDEIGRVLSPGGVGYLATPNRWSLVEPHFRVPFLSWPPRRLRSAYLRVTGRGNVYDVDPYGPRELRAAFAAAGLDFADKALSAVDELIRLERPGILVRVLAKLPVRIRRAVLGAVPTMIYVIRRPS